MAKRYDFDSIVSARSRRIARDAQQRAQQADGVADKPGRERTPTWLKRLMSQLPEKLINHLRDAVGPDPRASVLDELVSQARRDVEDLRVREAVVTAARRELVQRERKIDAQELSITQTRAQLEAALTAASQAAEQASSERRVPIGKILYDVVDSPRPIKDVNRLAVNMKRFGQLSPVVVRPAPGGRLTLLTGYRRMEAMKAAAFTHVSVRVLEGIDEQTAAALYAAENFLATDVSTKSLERLAQRIDSQHPLQDIIAMIQRDDQTVVEDVFLDDMAEQAHLALAEGAAWVAALRPYWQDLAKDDRVPLEQLIVYFARISKRLR